MDGSIYSKRCWIEGRLQEGTIYLAEGRIGTIEKGIRGKGATDFGDAVIMPGVIDAHVHVNEPGRTEWEGFDTATLAAAAGGITTIVDMPLNSSPVTTSVAALHQKLAAAQVNLHVNCGFYGGLVPGNAGELEGLIKEGVMGIKAFLTHSGIDDFPNVGEAELNEAMPLLARYGVPLLVHCELSDVHHQQLLASVPQNYRYYLDSRPDGWETKAVAMMIRLCRQHTCPVHIVHVSSAGSLELIRAAKEEGLPLTAETCPHYLFFNAESIPDASTIYKCAPPVRTAENNMRLKKAMAEGILDFLASDHSPAPPEIKEIESGNLMKAWGGIAGLQFLLSASWSSLQEIMPLEKFIPLLTEQPAAFIKTGRKGYIREGYDADLVVWQPGHDFVVKAETILHKHKISPYVSRRLYGTVVSTYVAGSLVWNKAAVIRDNGRILRHH